MSARSSIQGNDEDTEENNSTLNFNSSGKDSSGKGGFPLEYSEKSSPKSYNSVELLNSKLNNSKNNYGENNNNISNNSSPEKQIGRASCRERV